MAQFTYNIYQFINRLMLSITNAITDNGGNITLYSEWLNTKIFDGTLINIGLTWNQLLRYGATWFLTIFFIVLVFKIVFKVIGLICLK